MAQGFLDNAFNGASSFLGDIFETVGPAILQGRTAERVAKQNRLAAEANARIAANASQNALALKSQQFTALAFGAGALALVAFLLVRRKRRA